MLGHIDLYLYYKVAFIMSQRFSIDDVESMIPFERDIYFEMMMAEKVAAAKQGE